MQVDIKEFTEESLVNELIKRIKRRNQGCCDYCGNPHSEPECEKSERHFTLVMNRNLHERYMSLLTSFKLTL